MSSKYDLGYQSKDDEICGAYGMHGEEKCTQEFGGEFEDLGLDGRIILKCILMK